jgi:two-component system, OmpR family, sensor histidine kinase BaeS
MRSLTFKLTLAFLFVGLIGAVLVAVFVRQRTRNEFDQFILDQNQQVLISNLTEYYQIHGSWAGVESVFIRPVQGIPTPSRDPSGRGEARYALFTITNAKGIIVFSGRRENIGQQLPVSELKLGEPLKLNGQTVGWLLFTPALDRLNPNTPEARFLVNVTQATIFSAVGAALLALVLGGILAYTLTRSLRELTAATQQLAKGKLGHRVKVRSQDELGVLANSFNQMSTELERANELRRQMTADIAHDLRTPLSVIMGYTEALSDGKLKGSPEMYAVMHTEAQHLSHLIDDLKTLSLADAGELPLTCQPVSPVDLILRTAAAHRVKAEKQEIAIQVEFAPDLPDVDVDMERMAQVMGNLVDNALRYTPPGGKILLTAAALENQVQVRVVDSGHGIAAENLPYLFERSFRADKARVQQDGETGLGLAIAKSLVEAHGGRISVESQPEQGTTFTISLPPSQSAQSPS